MKKTEKQTLNYMLGDALKHLRELQDKIQLSNELSQRSKDALEWDIENIKTLEGMIIDNLNEAK